MRLLIKIRCQNDYVRNITTIFRHAILIMIIRLVIPTNIKIAKSGTRVVGSFMRFSALEPLVWVLWTLSNAQHIQ